MREILIAAGSPEVLAGLRRALAEAGIAGCRVCRSGADALGICKGIRDGVLICHKLQDMPSIALAREVPGHIDVLLLLPGGQRPLEGVGNVLCMNLPLNKPEFLRCVRELMASGSQRRGDTHRRGAEQDAVILEAKRLLLERDGMPEWAAHRFLQQQAMRSGKTLAQVAGDITCR
jgi:response regulator NasT